MFSDQISAIVGLVGVGLYLGSYALLQSGRLRADRPLYPILNILAATCVLIELQQNFNLPSVLIQISWILISLGGLMRIYDTSSDALPPRNDLSDVVALRYHSFRDRQREVAAPYFCHDVADHR